MTTRLASHQVDRTGHARRRSVGAFCALALAILTTTSAWSTGTLAQGSRVLLIAAVADDPRLEAAREAIRFWNGVFAELDLQPRFAPARTLTAPNSTRDFENHARRLSQQAGRSREGTRVGDGPAPPAALVELDAEIVVLLSTQRIKPFSWPISEDRRFFIAVPTALDAAGVRAVLAHELGHALGLEHREDRTLMCHPCVTPTDGDETEEFPPLHAADRSRLRALYATSARSRSSVTP